MYIGSLDPAWLPVTGPRSPLLDSSLAAISSGNSMGRISVQNVGEACKDDVGADIEQQPKTRRNGTVPRIAFDLTSMITDQFERIRFGTDDRITQTSIYMRCNRAQLFYIRINARG